MGDAFQGTNPYHYALSCISGKWKMSILNHINYYGYIRFTKTKKTFPVSEKVLSQQLKELVADGLVERIQYNEIPLRVEYRLTESGQKIMPIVDLLYTWSIDRMRKEGIEIDPDAFIVHSEKRHEVLLLKFLECYEDFCALYEYADKYSLTMSTLLEIIKEKVETSE